MKSSAPAYFIAPSLLNEHLVDPSLLNEHLVDHSLLNEHLLDPIELFEDELRDKSYKKDAIQSIEVIALTLSHSRIAKELIPLLSKTFLNQSSQQIKICILNNFIKVLAYIQNHLHCCLSALEMLIDILCVYPEHQIRISAFKSLHFVINVLVNKHFLKCEEQILDIVEILEKQQDKLIKELVLKIIVQIYPVINEKYEGKIIKIIKTYSENLDLQVILATNCNEIIKNLFKKSQKDVIQLFQLLLNSESSKVRCLLIDPIILLAQMLGKEQTVKYLQKLMMDVEGEVIASLFLKILQIQETFEQEIYLPLLLRVQNFGNESNIIKISIIEVLEHIPLSLQIKQKQVINGQHCKSLSLMKILSNTLCRIQDIHGLSLLIQNSDNQFKIKIFAKLPKTSNLHIQVLQSIFKQKNWRGKLTVLQNIEKRISNQEDVELFLPILFDQLGDKIAIVRSQSLKIINLIQQKKRISMQDMKIYLQTSFLSKNWFERQSAMLVVENIAKEYQGMESEDQSLLKKFINAGLIENIPNIQSIAANIQLHIQQ